MKIAIVKLSALGDIIQSAFVVQFIKQKVPEATIDWIVEQKYCDILKEVEGIENVKCVHLDGVKKNLFRIFKEKNKIKSFGEYDIVIDMQGFFKSALVARFLSKKTVGFDRYCLNEGLAAFFYRKKVYVDPTATRIQRYKSLVSAALNINIDNEEILQKKPYMSAKNTIDSLKSTTKKAVFIIGAKHLDKSYSKENFIRIAQMLREAYSMEVFIPYRNDKEFNKAKFIEQNSKNVHVLPKSSYSQIKGVFSKVDLVIGNDSGLTYLGWANNIPTVILHPKKGESTLLESTNCYCVKLKNQNDTINRIEPKTVIEYVEKMLTPQRS
jgi:heptosyltransferase-1